MKKYVIGATDVKIITLGLSLYRDSLLEVARRFLSGYNVSYELKEAVHREVEALEKLLSQMSPETEFTLNNPDDQTKRVLISGCRIFAGVYEEVKKRLAERVGKLDSKELDYLEKRLKGLLESPILLEA
ncbi:MAG: hypothetical protein RMJ28_00785 [Nitrososphaerota archaeon]|nr:hypothetical protein [Candidatus Calditenuaceae archaeon]MDW8072768.1 hypothetical protein [Nitrososphaerota archaeon]